MERGLGLRPRCVLRAALLAAATVAAACERAEQPAQDPAAQPIEGEADSAWVEMMGTWAPEGTCGDVTKEWRLEAESFHLFETHCAIERLELLQNGVRAVAHCSVEGDDDRVADAFKFVRRPDYTLSIINEANESSTDGLLPCEGEAP